MGGLLFPQLIGTHEMTLRGYDLGGNAIPGASDTVTLSSLGVNTQMAIEDPHSQISFFEVVESAVGGECRGAIDDLSFDELPAVIPPDFGLISQSLGVTVAAGSSATATIHVNRTASSTGPISFGVSGLPSGVGASVSPNPDTTPASSSVTLMFIAAPNAPPVTNATATITATPSGTAGSQTRSVTIPVSVSGNFDLRAQGIDVTQGIQREGTLAPSGGESGGSYQGVKLVEYEKTAVRFYADAQALRAPASPV